jgi:tetratricopeptide (TPR) repeat protein
VKDVKEQFIDLRNLIASRLVLPPAPEPERAGRNAGARDTGLRPVDASGAQPEPWRPTATPAATPAHSVPSMIEPAEGPELTAVIEAPDDTTGAGTTSDQNPDSCERTDQPAASVEDLEGQRQAKAVELCSDANAHLGRGDYEAAIQAYDEALEENPDYIAAYYNRGSAYIHVGALDSAIADFTQVLQLDPSQLQAYRQRALIYARKGDYERAVRDYNAALAALENRGAAQSDPDTVNAVTYDRANAHFRLGAYEQALADYSVNVAHAPDHVEAHLNRGLTYAALGNYPEALRDFNQAIALAPHQALIYHHRGQVYARTERYTEALKDYDRALDLNPRYATVHNNRGLLYVKIEAYPQALDAYQQAMALQPDWATPYYNAACAAALIEDVEQACIWLARAIALREAYRAMALRDPDLAAIRQHARFRALVESTQ